MTELESQSKLRSVKSIQSKNTSDEAPPLPDTYHRARRNLVLFSALLLSWEFVGIKPNEETSTSLIGISFSIANPQAIPFVVFLLVMFFFVRFEVEWRQVSTNRRKNVFAKVDAIVSRVLAGLAILVFTFQAITDIEIATVFLALTPQNQIATLASVIGLFVALWMSLPDTHDLYWGKYEGTFGSIMNKASAIGRLLLAYTTSLIVLSPFALLSLGQPTGFWLPIVSLLCLASHVLLTFHGMRKHKKSMKYAFGFSATE